ncbi:Glutaredoxin [Actinomyces denticolens]|uniref:Glutaredoxin n=1 Tax=Actinomyces denticolens TaxID=52767 RepID=A0ABY1IGD0_9ACTO|nr:glutaredoxin domain-containing protein [Actinomyces denticolens]SHJ13410.1 Glutaredoxin [Actinomyces denticolens]
MEQGRKLTYIERSDLPDDVREHLDTLIEPHNPFSFPGGNFVGITPQGKLHYVLYGDTERIVDLDDDWRQQLDADWQNIQQRWESAPALIDRAWQILTNTGKDLSDRDAINPSIMPANNDGVSLSIEIFGLGSSPSDVTVTVWPNDQAVGLIFNQDGDQQLYMTADDATQAINNRWQHDIQIARGYPIETLSNADERADWVPLDYRDLSSDRRSLWEERCDQPLPEELRAYLDGLTHPPSPYTVTEPAAFGIIPGGGLRYDLAPVGDSRPRYLAPAPVETWIESISTEWDTGCQHLLEAHDLVARARDIMNDAGIDLEQFRYDGAGARYQVRPRSDGGVSLALYTSDMPDFLIRVFADPAEFRVGVTWLDHERPEWHALQDEQLLSPYSAARAISSAWRDAALGPHPDGIPRTDDRVEALTRWAQSQGALAGAEVDIRSRFRNAGGDRVEISSSRIKISPRDVSRQSMVLEITADDPGTVTVVEWDVAWDPESDVAWNPESREPLPVREAMEKVRQAFPDATTAVLDPAPAATVYTKEDCIACEMTKKQFARAGVSVDVVRLEDHPEVVERAREMGLMSAPLVATPDGRMTAGFDPQRIRDIVAASSPAAPAVGRGPERLRSGAGPARPLGEVRGRGVGL